MSLRGTLAGYPTSVLLVSLIHLLWSLANELLSWAETHPVRDLEALEAVLEGCSRLGDNDQLWRVLNIEQQRQDSSLRRVEQANIWHARASGTADRRDDTTGANKIRYRDTPGSPQLAQASAVT